MLVELSAPGGAGGEAGPGALAEWAMVELQGELKIKAHQGLHHLGRQEAGSQPGLEFGVLELLEGGAKAALVIGPHRLTGERVELRKPFLVLGKETEPAGGGGAGGEAGGAGEGEAAGEPPRISYKVKGIVRSKLHFARRPQILITKPKRMPQMSKRRRALPPVPEGAGGSGAAAGAAKGGVAPCPEVGAADPAEAEV